MASSGSGYRPMTMCAPGVCAVGRRCWHAYHCARPCASRRASVMASCKISSCAMTVTPMPACRHRYAWMPLARRLTVSMATPSKAMLREITCSARVTVCYAHKPSATSAGYAANNQGSIFMWNPKLLHRLVACAAPLGAVAVLACGPDFSVQMLDDRSATLKATPANNFAFEAAHLVSASDKLSAQENQVAAPADDVRLKVMHDQADGDAAYAAGTGLPPALRLYTAAALDYRNAQAAGATAEPMLKRASQRFQAVLDLSPGDAAPRVVWAA